MLRSDISMLLGFYVFLGLSFVAFGLCIFHDRRVRFFSLLLYAPFLVLWVAAADMVFLLTDIV